MRDEMEAMRLELSKRGSDTSSRPATTAAKSAAKAKASPKTKAKPKAKGDTPEEGNSEPEPESVEKSTPATIEAKRARLRRLCEMKPSGKIKVPAEVHERWKTCTSAERDAMVEEFENADWNKDTSLVVFMCPENLKPYKSTRWFP